MSIDVAQWAAVFAIFAVSFQASSIISILSKQKRKYIVLCIYSSNTLQLGFISLTAQANEDPLKPYPDGAFPVAFFTILGELDPASQVQIPA